MRKVEVRECVDCGDEISQGRMRALPNVKFCVGCQEEIEHRGQFRRSVIDVQPDIESWENVGITLTLVKGTEVG